jgi:hypothetical protein
MTLLLSLFALSAALALPPVNQGGPGDGTGKPVSTPPPADLIVSNVYLFDAYDMAVTITNQGWITSVPTVLNIEEYQINPYIVLGWGQYYVPEVYPNTSCTLYISTNYDLTTFGYRVDFNIDPYDNVVESNYVNNWYTIYNGGYSY